MSFKGVVRWLVRTRTRGAFSALSIVGVVAVGDYFTGREIAFSFFYVAPVLIASWAGGFRLGVLLSFVSGAAFVSTDALAGESFSSGWVPFWNFAVRAGTLVTIALLAGRLRETLDQERALARIDPMTGIANARSFRERLELECARVSRHGPPLSLAFIDLDGFKSVNDNQGHEAGDDLLRAFGGLLQQTVRSIDVVGRLGGDEFALLLPDTAEEGAMRVVERLRVATDELDLERVGAGYSLGLATLRYPNPTADEALWLSDKLMYRAKRAGRNQVRAGTYDTPPRAINPTSRAEIAR